MVGQTQLLERINEYSVDTFPRTVLLIGESGIGKHTLAKYIQENIIKLPLLDITNNISAEYIDEIYRNPNPAIYLIDMSQMNDKNQYVLLKFTEEPLNNAFIILLAESKAFILNTILNRALIFELAPYTKDELKTFITTERDVDLVLQILRTPGKILSTNVSNLREMFDVCDKIVNKISVATYPNTLTIADKVNFKDEYNKFDIDVFLDVLSFSLLSHYRDTNNIETLNMLSVTRELRKSLADKRINKALMFEHLLTKLWQVSRGS